MNQRNLGALFIFASAAGFATLAIFIKFAMAAGANITTILSGRFLMAGLFLFLVLKARNISARIDSKLAIQLCLLGAVGYGGMSMLFANSLYYLPASLTAMLLYTYPAIVSLLSFVLGDERFGWYKGIALFICFAGLFLVLGVSFAGVQMIGVLSVLGAAAIYSCYIIVGNRLLKSVDALVTTTYVCSAAGVTFLLYGLLSNDLIFDLPVKAWLEILGIAIFPTLIAVLTFFSGLRLIGATNASIISTLEPLITVMLSALLLGEKITLVQAGGGLLLLTGVVILQLWAGESPAAAAAEDI